MINENKISLSINILLIVSCLFIQLGRCNPTYVSSWYKTELTNRVIPPYREVYTTLNEKIVQPLLIVNVDSDEKTIETLFKNLVCASRYVKNKLSQATGASEQIRNSLDGQITQLVLSISNQENKVRESQQVVHQANINIHNAQEQITWTENTVRDKQNALNAAEHAMQEAQKDVDRARLCGRKRRKRGFGKWWRKKVEKPFVKIIRQTVIKPVCSVVNSGGIDNAKERRGLAQQNLNDAQQRLIQQQQTLAHHRTQHSIAQTQLQEANSQLNILTNQLHEQRAQQIVITVLAKQFKAIEIHLTNVFGSSKVLADAINKLVDFELVIEPLNAIYQQMINNDLMISFNFKISAEMASTIVTNLNVLRDKMPNMPINEFIANDINIVCT